MSMFGLIILTSVLLILMTTLFNYSMKYVTASMSSVIIYLAIPASYMLDFFFMGTQVGAIEIIGACMIVTVNVALGYLKA